MLKQYDPALADLDKAIELRPKEAAFFRNRGFADIGKFDYGKALEDFGKAIELDPKDAVSYERRGLANRSLRNYDAAIADYSKSLEIKADDGETWARRGYTYTFLGQYEKAIADYEQAMKVNPNDTETPQRLLYAKSQLAQRNAPPPAPTVAATPTPNSEERDESDCHRRRHLGCYRCNRDHRYHGDAPPTPACGREFKANSVAVSTAPIANRLLYRRFPTVASFAFSVDDMRRFETADTGLAGKRNFFDTRRRAGSLRTAFCGNETVPWSFKLQGLTALGFFLL